MRHASQARRSSLPWTGFKKVLAIAMMLQQLAPLGASAALRNQTGRWVAGGNLKFSGTHVAVLRKPGTDSTTVFLFGESGKPQTMKYWRIRSADLVAQVPDTVSLITIPHPNGLETDLFCTGHTTLADGKLLLMGGGWIPPVPCKEVYTFDPAWVGGMSPTLAWSDNAAMAVDRWYGTATALADGKVLASAGTMSSEMVGFGGLAVGTTTDTTWRVLQPLELSGRFVWGDTTGIPLVAADLCGGFSHRDNFTAGQFPPGRVDHAFIGDPSNRAILYGGQRKLANGSYELLDDAWFMEGPPCGNDTTHTWRLLEQVADPVAGLPPKRTRFAACWAGVENRPESYLPDALNNSVCYIQGGLDVNLQPLGDLWRGERQSAGLHYRWQWTQVLSNQSSTKRYGHTMVFDPGPPVLPAQQSGSAVYGQLIIFGGRTESGALSDPAHLYAVGLGNSSDQPGFWRDLTISGAVPPAREAHALAPRWRTTNATRREYLLFGGEDATGTPVAPDLWRLSRPDLTPADRNQYAWQFFPAASGSPQFTGRSGAAAAYNEDSGLLVVVGGDKDGSAIPGNLTNEIWTTNARIVAPSGTLIAWAKPTMRTFPQHPGPPPIKGMGLIAAGPAGSRVTRTLERFTPSGTSSPGDGCTETLAGQWQTVTTPDSTSERAIALYPYMFQLPDGRMFDAGPAPYDNPANLYKRFYNLTLNRWEESSAPYSANHDAELFGSAVMYRPGQLLRAGSHGEGQPQFHGISNTETISIGAGQTPPWVSYDATALGHPALLARTNHNLTLLPTGDILATGGLGAHAQWDLNVDPVKQPQIWRAADAVWSNANLQGSEYLAADPYIRNYHSTAILLPDARILTVGGEVPSLDEKTVSVFEPPYLFQGDNPAARPHVLLAPPALTYGHTFTLTLLDANHVNTIRSIALMRPSAVTHGFDQNQHYVPLAFAVAQSPPRLLVQAPANAYLAAPGDHMLFVVDNLGTDAPAVPSVAYWTRAGAAVTPVDPADVTPPMGGSYLNLHDAGACTNDPSNPVLRLAWMAPADDDTIAFSGPATSYYMRYKLNSNPEPIFNNWPGNPPTSAPSAPFATDQVNVYGLSANTWYQFALKTVDDNANSSNLSNTTIAKPSITSCDGGGGGFFDGDGSVVAPGGAQLLAAQASETAPGTGGSENSLFPGASLDSLATDALQFEGSPPVLGGTRTVYVHEGSGAGLSLDRARLLAADHVLGTEAVASSDGRFLSGSRVAATRIEGLGGRDLTAAGTGSSAEPLYADSGQVLTVTLPTRAQASEDVLLLDTSDGTPGPGGIAVEASSANGLWTTLARVHPRRRANTQAIPVTGATALRLRCDVACLVRFVGRLAEPAGATVTSAALLTATSRGTAWTEQVRVTDGSRAIVPPRDTLLLTYADTPQAEGLARDWFLVLDGVPVSANVAMFMASRAQDDRDPAVAFRLHQNIPNPFQHTTLIAFDLPVATDARLEIFDMQGRLVRRFAGRREAGRHAIEWDLRDAGGRMVQPGIYAYRLRAGKLEARRKMVVIP